MAYEGYEVHKTLPAWGGELIAVLKNGNKGRIVSMTTRGVHMVLQVQLSEINTCEVSELEVDHYLTPPKSRKESPDHPGLWKDKDGNLWVYDDTYLRLVKVGNKWDADGKQEAMAEGKALYFMFAFQYAPFTEMEVKEKDHAPHTPSPCTRPLSDGTHDKERYS